MAHFLACSWHVVAFICAFRVTEGMPSQGHTLDAAVPLVTQAGMEYMKAFYIGRSGDEEVPLEPTAENLKIVVKDIQRLAGINQTGEIDEPTARAMMRPRCGCHDIIDVTVTDENEKRYEAVGPNNEWPKTDLTYRISNYPTPWISTIQPYEVDEAVAAALKYWSDVTPLTFQRVPRSFSADIEMTFARGDHRSLNPLDIYPFDGPGMVTAHGFFPGGSGTSLDGDVHYDDDEIFTHEAYYGINFMSVVAHEVGHALGLRHSDVYDAVMYAYTKEYSPYFQLHQDDIDGIQSIYGPNPNRRALEAEPTTPAPIPTTTATPPEYCEFDFDDVAMIRGEIFAFLEEKFWRFSGSGHLVEDGANIESFFPNYSPYGVDGIVELPFEKVIRIARGLNVYDISGQQLDLVEERSLLDFDIPSGINCAMHSASKQVTYYFLGGLVYKYDEARRSMTTDSPSEIHEVFQGIPSGTIISAAFTGTDGYYYLLVGREYYMVDPDLKRVGDLSNFGQDFLRCPRDD